MGEIYASLEVFIAFEFVKVVAPGALVERRFGERLGGTCRPGTEVGPWPNYTCLL